MLSGKPPQRCALVLGEAVGLVGMLVATSILQPGLSRAGDKLASAQEKALIFYYACGTLLFHTCKRKAGAEGRSECAKGGLGGNKTTWYQQQVGY